MALEQKPKFIKKIYIRSQMAEAAPPLGTILGNLGAIRKIFVLVLIYLLKKSQIIFY
jgi:hypothetical protein